MASTTGDDFRVGWRGRVTTRQPLDARREALARAIGHLLAEVVWAEIVEATPHDSNNEDRAVPVNTEAAG